MCISVFTVFYNFVKLYKCFLLDSHNSVINCLSSFVSLYHYTLWFTLNKLQYNGFGSKSILIFQISKALKTLDFTGVSAPTKIHGKFSTTIFSLHENLIIYHRGVAKFGYRTWFGTKGSGVQIPSPRPRKPL